MVHSLNKFCDVAKERCQKVEIVKVTLDEITEEVKEFDTIILNSKPIKDIKKMHYVSILSRTMTTHAESINSDLQRGLDRHLQHTQH